MTGDDLPPYIDLVKPKGEKRTAYQAVAVAHDGSVTRGKLQLSLDAAKGDALVLGRPGRSELADVRIEFVEIYDNGIPAGASDARDKHEEEQMQKKKRKAITKGAPARKAAPKKAAPAKVRASRNGHAPTAIDLVRLKGGSRIVATFKGGQYFATIITDKEGKHVVLYAGQQYGSLSGAAAAVIRAANGPDTKARANGRTFWKVA